MDLQRRRQMTHVQLQAIMRDPPKLYRIKLDLGEPFVQQDCINIKQSGTILVSATAEDLNEALVKLINVATLC